MEMALPHTLCDSPAAPLVSVVIPCYNSEQWIADAITSALGQTYENKEIWIINDGSTDSSRDVILRQFGDKVHYCEQPNSGPSRARNRGIAQSRGEYIAFLDADDLWMPRKLEKQVAFMRLNPQYPMSFTRCLAFHMDRCTKAPPTTPLPHGGQMFSQILFRNPIALPSVVFRRDCLDRIGYFNEALLTGEDIELYLRVSRQYPIGFVDEILVKVRKHPQSLTQRPRPVSGIVEALESLHKYFPELSPDQDMQIRKALGFHCLRKGRELMYWDMYAAAYCFFRKAIGYTPYNFKIPLYAAFLFFLIPCRRVVRMLKRKGDLLKCLG